jgi:hypothetical protein
MIAIQSINAPPERHADRVIAAMLRDLARRRAEIAKAIITARLTSRDGQPRAQQRMVERIRKAGAVDVTLKPGTRGRYELTIYELVGWDPIRDAEIRVNDPLPAKPWVAAFITRIANRGRDVKSAPMLFISCHCLSRCAQRFGLRVADEIITTSLAIWGATLDMGTSEDMTPQQLFNPPPQGHRAVVDGGEGKSGMVVVLRKHEQRNALVAATVLWERDGPSEPLSAP